MSLGASASSLVDYHIEEQRANMFDGCLKKIKVLHQPQHPVSVRSHAPQLLRVKSRAAMKPEGEPDAHTGQHAQAGHVGSGCGEANLVPDDFAAPQHP